MTLHFVWPAKIMGITTLFATLLSASVIYAEETASTVAKWEESNQRKTLTINVSDLLTPSQREIVNSGFSTFTLMTVTDNHSDGSNSANKTTDTSPAEKEDPIVFRLACSVKFDTWEERYQIIRIDPAPVLNLTASDYKAWSAECLSMSLSNQDTLNKLAHGGTLSASLQIRQSSPDEGAKIKSWLVRQQSGFMQGLYAHMLGDFQFRGQIKIGVQVPPRPSTTRETQKTILPSKKAL